nr:MAG TPA: hypothetical protein [Caudoviricetes sp.]
MKIGMTIYMRSATRKTGATLSAGNAVKYA